MIVHFNKEQSKIVMEVLRGKPVKVPKKSSKGLSRSSLNYTRTHRDIHHSIT